MIAVVCSLRFGLYLKNRKNLFARPYSFFTCTWLMLASPIGIPLKKEERYRWKGLKIPSISWRVLEQCLELQTGASPIVFSSACCFSWSLVISPPQQTASKSHHLLFPWFGWEEGWDCLLLETSFSKVASLKCYFCSVDLRSWKIPWLSTWVFHIPSPSSKS